MLKIIIGVRSSLVLIVSVFHVDLKKTQVVSVTYTKNAFQFIYTTREVAGLMTHPLASITGFELKKKS